MGLLGGFSPLAITDHQLLAPVPSGWSFEQAAAIPVVFLTAYYGLRDLAELGEGKRVLVHAATGGVGMAAVQLARHLGAEVFATASPGKWDTLREMGFDEAHIASSRTAEFEQRFLRETGGEGVDVVLDCLAGELVEASLRLLPRGGRFVEMGKTDLRDAERVAAEHPGVVYRAFDVVEAGPERIAGMLAELLALFERGALRALPVSVWEVRRAPEALRFLSQARHTGKLVLRMPPAVDPRSTALLTGGTGGLGALLAEHLVSAHGVRSLLLASRRGPEAQGAEELRARLQGLGARVEIVACDVSERAQVQALLARVPEEYPLGAVIHTAGTIDDGVIDALTPERVDGVLAAKVDGALHLHELTRGLDLWGFVLFSSLAGTYGAPGQGNYAAANVFLDGLAAHRRAQGLPGSALAWGMWAQDSAMTGALTEADLARIERSGVSPLSPAEGLELFDAARALDRALVIPARLNIRALRAIARIGGVPPLLRGLIRAPTRRARAASGSLAARLAGISAGEREGATLQIVRAEIAAVLGHSSAEKVDAARALQGPRVRLALGDRAAQPPRRQHRADTPRHTRIRLPDAGRAGSASAGGGCGRPGLGGAREPCGGAGRRADRDRGHGLSLSGWGELARRVVGACGERRRRDLRVSHGSWVGSAAAARRRPGASGCQLCARGGFLADAAEFDPRFFGISPLEALAMDPQQRLLLEVSWEAIEDAGLDPDVLRGSHTGVFAGTSSQDYGLLMPEGAGVQQMASSLASVLSGRVAYTFGLEGPAVTVDTACSSSLVAMHLACQALRGGECSLALAGGVTVLATPSAFVGFAYQRGLARDGRCKSFADAADGTSFSEGIGLVLLERLSDAQRNGHEVLGLVRGSAVNQDGASNGLTAPEWPLSAAGDPRSARARGAGPWRGGCRRGARDGHDARRSDRGAGAAGDLRAGPRGGAPGVDRVDQVQHRARSGGGGRRGRDQDGDGVPARAAAQDAARRRALHPRRVVGGQRLAAERVPAVAAGRQAAPRRGLIIRDQRHQRPRDPRGGARGGTRW